MWDPSAYLRYRDERSRPFIDLVQRIDVESPRVVVDLGCGPGNLTVDLARRWPSASITGLDSSMEMIDRARALDSAVNFMAGDVNEWSPSPDTDVIISNATLQWVPRHDELLTRWVRQLSPGGWLAVQVPGNFNNASHESLRAVATQQRWHDRVAHTVRDPGATLDPVDYAQLLMASDCTVDAWETTYLHVLPAGDEHPVLAWLEGTALRPVRAALPVAQDWADFRDELRTQLADAYPVRDGVVFFPFRRIFFVAHIH